MAKVNHRIMSIVRYVAFSVYRNMILQLKHFYSSILITK